MATSRIQKKAYHVNLGHLKRYPTGPHGLKLSRGNIKLSEDTLIMNMGSGTDCPSKALGLCKVVARFPGNRHACYACKTESIRPNALKRRDYQSMYWRHATVQEIIWDLSAILTTYKDHGIKIKFFRFNESGDFWTQGCVHKLSRIAEYLKSSWGIKTYGYSARSDLDFTGASFIVRGSGWEGPSGQTTVIARGEEVPAGYKLCPGDCRKCNLCKTRKGNIAFRLH